MLSWSGCRKRSLAWKVSTFFSLVFTHVGIGSSSGSSQLPSETNLKKSSNSISSGWIARRSNMSFQRDGIHQSFHHANIISNIPSCRRDFSQWRRQNDINLERQVEELKKSGGYVFKWWCINKRNSRGIKETI